MEEKREIDSERRRKAAGKGKEDTKKVFVKDSETLNKKKSSDKNVIYM